MGHLDDGLGERWLESYDRRMVEVLEVAPRLASSVAFEDALRARAARFAGMGLGSVAGVTRIDRDGESLRVVTEHIPGPRLQDLLTAIGQPPAALRASLALATRLTRAVAAVHERPGLSHGAITPAHVVLTAGGTIVLTDCAFGGAFESLRWNRERLWREFGVALPASASIPRFDTRSDVTQLGATILAVLLGRPLRPDEYPGAMFEFVNTVTTDAEPDLPGSTLSRLRLWLCQALQLHPRGAFASAVDAESALADILSAPTGRRADVVAFRAGRGNPGPASTGLARPSNRPWPFPDLRPT